MTGHYSAFFFLFMVNPFAGVSCAAVCKHRTRAKLMILVLKRSNRMNSLIRSPSTKVVFQQNQFFVKSFDQYSCLNYYSIQYINASEMQLNDIQVFFWPQSRKSLGKS